MPARAVLRGSGPFAAAALWLALLAGAWTQPAYGHPLGNSSVNHLTYVKVFPDRVSMLYVLDQAEYPTLRDLRRGTPERLFLRKLEEVRRGLLVRVGGRRGKLDFNPNPQMRFRRGVSGLPTVRIALRVIVRANRPRRVVVEDATFLGQLGVVLVVPLSAAGTSVRRLDGPVDDPSKGLRLVPPDGKYEDRRAVLAVSPGRGTVTGSAAPRPVAPGTGREFKPGNRGDAFSRLFESAASGEGVFVLFLLAAFAWGALHALSPGHGKGMVAAYLVGTRGHARDAVALGGIVTVTHTAGVFALGLVTLLLTQYVLPEDVYPWLNLVAGLLIVGVGLGVLRSRIRWGREQRGLHPDAHLEEHAHVPGMPHHHHHPATESRGGLVAMGMSAGLIPCPSALVVLLAALTQHQMGLGLVLIVAFSIGLATTLTVLGLLVVYARRAGGQLPVARRMAATRVGAFLPALSTVLILGVGALLTARALPGVL